MTDFEPYKRKIRKSGTGCISQINDHLFEGRYSPMWMDSKKRGFNIYAKTREKVEVKLVAFIVEVKAEKKACWLEWRRRTKRKTVRSVRKSDYLQICRYIGIFRDGR